MILTHSLRRIPSKLYNPETLSFRDRIIANGGTISETSLDYVEKFVQDCKNANLWDQFLEIGLFVGTGLNAALVKLVYSGSPSTLTNVNFTSGDYAETGVNGGLAGDGATKYLNTGFNSLNLPDNGHLSFYLREDVVSAGNRGLLGSIVGSDQYWLGASNPAADISARYGQSITATVSAPLTKGFHVVSRASSSNLRLYKDGDLIDTDSAPVAHTKPNQNIHLWAFNSSGSPAAYLPARGSFYSIGQSLNDSEAAALYQAVRALQRNLNRL